MQASVFDFFSMPIITLTTDFGTRDPYVAALKAAILKEEPGTIIVVISHEVERYSIPHASYLLTSVFRDFPTGTIHIVSVHSLSYKQHKFIALKIDEHYFVGSDNGLFSLLSESPPQQSVRILNEKAERTVFPAKDIFVPAALTILRFQDLLKTGEPINSIETLTNLKSYYQNNILYGNIIHVDGYENLITNIDFMTFEKIRNGRKFLVRFGKEKTDFLGLNYNSVQPGQCVCLFNSNNYLEIAINQGKAASLLGLGYNKKVMVEFF